MRIDTLIRSAPDTKNFMDDKTRQQLNLLRDHHPGDLAKNMCLDILLKEYLEAHPLDPENDFDLNPHIQILHICKQVSELVVKEGFNCTHDEVMLMWLTTSIYAEQVSLRNEIKKFKKSIEDWKDAWHQLRDIIGNLWWRHPAIDNDERRAYYQHQLDSITPVTYCGFVATKGDWHYQAWINQTESLTSECQKEQSK